MAKSKQDTRVQKLHFMGIGGSGISAVAKMAVGAGYQVSGCDLEESSITNRLRKEGLNVSIGHDASHLKNIDLLIHTPAVFYQSEKSPEYVRAADKGISLTWEEFMAKYLQHGKYVISVAGTHGKGTTTAVIARILELAGLDPTCEVGANLLDWDRRNFRLGKGKYFVHEADEFREKFLLYRPDMAVITSIEMDHPEYYRDLDSILIAFRKFVTQIKSPGVLVINGEDLGCSRLLKDLKRAKWPGKIIEYSRLSKRQVTLKLPGEHLLSDAAAAYAVAKELGISEAKIKTALESFGGLERRFELRGEFGQGVKLYDDYAHHPTAVAANIIAAKGLYPKRRIVVVFQPHMHARLKALYTDFVRTLKLADKVVVTDVYTRREQGVTQPSGKELALSIGAPKATYVGGDLQNVANFVDRNSQKGDIVLVLGAGDVFRVSDLLLGKS